jgi:hypothetical protein
VYHCIENLLDEMVSFFSSTANWSPAFMYSRFAKPGGELAREPSQIRFGTDAPLHHSARLAAASSAFATTAAASIAA